jgi:predicted ATPase
MRCLSNDVEVTTPRALRAVLVASGPKGDESEPTVSLLSSVADALASALAALRDDSVPGMRAVVDAGEIDTAPAVAADDPGIRRALAVFRASRPRQLLVTGAAVDLLAGPMADLELVDRGVHRLHGFDRPVRVFSGRGPSLSDAEPRTIDTVATSVPVPTSPLIGREELLADLAAAIRSERIVTLTGTGGSGKTRLSIEVAAAIAGAFDAVHWVDLSAVTSGGGVIDEVAAVIGLHGGRSTSLLDRIAHRLRGESSLLVFDNAEHLIEATATVGAPLLHRCPGLRIMVTSREALGIEGEVVRSVPPLELPTGSSADAIASSEAGVFLVDRLRRAGLRLVPDESNAALIHRICVRLDGIPLALELAAARGATLSLEDLAAQLDGRFSRMSATRRDAVPRQRTLDASVRWSHDLLTADEQTVFRRLAVFSGWFRPSDAEAIIGDDADGFDLVSRLVGQSLIVRRADGCLRLLETVRSFAEDRLDESGEALATRNRHVQWLLDVSRRIEPLFDGPDPSQAVAETRAHLADLRAALIHCESARDAANMWTLLARLVNYFWYQGNLDEALDWCARAAQVDDGTDPSRSRGGPRRGGAPRHLARRPRRDRRRHRPGDPRCDRRWRPTIRRPRAGCSPVRTSPGATPPPAASAIAQATTICERDRRPFPGPTWARCGAALALTFLGRPLDAIAALDDRRAHRADALDVRRLMMEVLARRCIAEYQLGRWGDCHHHGRARPRPRRRLRARQRHRLLRRRRRHARHRDRPSEPTPPSKHERGHHAPPPRGRAPVPPVVRLTPARDALTATGCTSRRDHTRAHRPRTPRPAVGRDLPALARPHPGQRRCSTSTSEPRPARVAQRLLDDATTIGNRTRRGPRQRPARTPGPVATARSSRPNAAPTTRSPHSSASALSQRPSRPSTILTHTDELLGRSDTRRRAVAERLTVGPATS